MIKCDVCAVSWPGNPRIMTGSVGLAYVFTKAFSPDSLPKTPEYLPTLRENKCGNFLDRARSFANRPWIKRHVDNHQGLRSEVSWPII